MGRRGRGGALPPPVPARMFAGRTSPSHPGSFAEGGESYGYGVARP